MNRLTARIIASPWTIPLLCVGVIISVLLSLWTIVWWVTSQDDQQREVQSMLCRDTNQLRRDVAAKGEATDVLVRSILDVVLRPGTGSPERQLQVREIYDDLEPVFEAHLATVDRISQQLDCSTIQEDQ